MSRPGREPDTMTGAADAALAHTVFLDAARTGLTTGTQSSYVVGLGWLAGAVLDPCPPWVTNQQSCGAQWLAWTRRSTAVPASSSSWGIMLAPSPNGCGRGPQNGDVLIDCKILYIDGVQMCLFVPFYCKFVLHCICLVGRRTWFVACCWSTYIESSTRGPSFWGI